MDKEIGLFFKKVKKLPVHTRLMWLSLFALKTSSDILKRKVFKRIKKRKTVSASIASSDHPWIEAALMQLNSQSYSLYDSSWNAVNINSSARQKVNKYVDEILAGNIKLASGKFKISFPQAWNISFDDVQDASQLSRFRYALWLVLALHWESDLKRDEIIKLLKESTSSWIDFSNKERHAGWEAYNTSERVIHWAWLLYLLPKDILQGEKEWLNRLLFTIRAEAVFLSKNFEYNLPHHNHLINNARALFTVASAFPFPESRQMKEYALKVFHEEWKYQVLADGAHAEQSSTYHFLLTRTLWEITQLMKRNSENVSPQLENQLSQMISYSADLVRPDGSIPLIGHITPDWHWSELVGLLPVWGKNIVQPSPLAVFYKSELPESTNPPAKQPDAKVYQAAGTGIIKAKDTHIVLSADPRCRLETHGDQNLLGVDVWYKGQNIIRDGGLDSYSLNNNRKWFESSEGQSSYIIDNVQPVVINWRRRQLPKQYFKATATIRAIASGNKFALEAKHNAYQRLSRPVSTARSISYTEGNALEIKDQCAGKGRHTYTATYNFGGLQPKTFGNALRLYSGVEEVAEIKLQPEIQFEIIPSFYADAYGAKHEARALRITQEWENEFEITLTIN